MSETRHLAWISQREARARLGIGIRRLARLIAEGYVGVRELPGGSPLLSREDVDRLAEASTRPARNGAAGVTAV